jgi:hypothetical protein
LLLLLLLGVGLKRVMQLQVTFWLAAAAAAPRGLPAMHQ